MTARILTTHAGSLPRPDALAALLARKSRGEPYDAAGLDAAVEDATTAIVARQVELDLDIVGNGEMGRESFFTYVRDRFRGFGGTGDTRPFDDLMEVPSLLARKARLSESGDSVSLLAVPAAEGEVSWSGPEAIDRELDQLGRAASAAGAQRCFVTAPSPGIVATAMTNRAYETLEEYVAALVAGLTEEYRRIVDAGFVLQIDAPDLAMDGAVAFGRKPRGEYLDFCRLVVAAINRAIAGLPSERVRLHVCWGNYDGPHVKDVPLEEILPIVTECRAGQLVLALANPRHAHELKLLADGGLPPRFGLVAGVIETTHNYVEHPEVVADRILAAVEIVGDPRRVQAGTDCGFATASGLGDVAPEVVWMKLASLAEGARRASERLYAPA
ncbi:MAG: cobalamin-independent methionine synthase II family protein [Actinomycetota bacterium]|nr:cobalamin-independent methionine synthase II family protein [Actinomycetota bacterium]